MCWGQLKYPKKRQSILLETWSRLYCETNVKYEVDLHADSTEVNDDVDAHVRPRPRLGAATEVSLRRSWAVHCGARSRRRETRSASTPSLDPSVTRRGSNLRESNSNLWRLHLDCVSIMMTSQDARGWRALLEMKKVYTFHKKTSFLKSGKIKELVYKG